MFFLDMFLGNYDRHENNWGFVKENGLYVLAPLYDMGRHYSLSRWMKLGAGLWGKLKMRLYRILEVLYS